MDSETTLFVLIALISFVYFALLSITQIVFKQVDTYTDSIKDTRTRIWIAKIEQILEDRLFFNNMMSVARLLSGTVFSIALFLVCRHTFGLTLWQSLVTATLVGTTIITFFAQMIFRALAMAHGEKLIFLSLTTFSLTHVVLFPISIIAGISKHIQLGTLKVLNYDERFAFLSNDEKERLSGPVDDKESLDKGERAMIRNIFDFGGTIVKEIMVPRVDLEALPVQTTYQEMLDFIKNEGHSRIPIYEENIDSIVGILNVKQILCWLADEEPKSVVSNWSLRNLMTKPYFVPSNKKLDDLMTDMKKNHIHIAVVVDEYGGTEGIVTMEDLLEEIVGEIHDEYDEEEHPVVKLSDRTYLVDPHMELYELGEIIPLNFPLEDKEYHTLGGLFYHEYGDVPETNTTFEYAGLKLRIRKMDNQRIEEIVVTVPDGVDTSEIDKAF